MKILYSLFILTLVLAVLGIAIGFSVAFLAAIIAIWEPGSIAEKISATGALVGVVSMIYCMIAHMMMS